MHNDTRLSWITLVVAGVAYLAFFFVGLHFVGEWLDTQPESIRSGICCLGIAWLIYRFLDIYRR